MFVISAACNRINIYFCNRYTSCNWFDWIFLIFTRNNPLIARRDKRSLSRHTPNNNREIYINSSASTSNSSTNNSPTHFHGAAGTFVHPNRGQLNRNNCIPGLGVELLNASLVIQASLRAPRQPRDPASENKALRTPRPKNPTPASNPEQPGSPDKSRFPVYTHGKRGERERRWERKRDEPARKREARATGAAGRGLYALTHHYIGRVRATRNLRARCHRVPNCRLLSPGARSHEKRPQVVFRAAAPSSFPGRARSGGEITTFGSRASLFDAIIPRLH